MSETKVFLSLGLAKCGWVHQNIHMQTAQKTVEGYFENCILTTKYRNNLQLSFEKCMNTSNSTVTMGMKMKEASHSQVY